jgi:hypothetical protein
MGIVGKAVEVSKLVGDLETELFYGLNLRITLVEDGTSEELQALRCIVDRAKKAREKIMARFPEPTKPTKR